MHFTVVKSQAILIIRLGVAEVISAVTLYLLPASNMMKISTSLDMFRLCNRAGNSEHKKTQKIIIRPNLDLGAFQPRVIINSLLQV